ncbi:MAG: phosphate signaling complex PhoU family protein [Actinomycetota bacterium]
MTEQPKRLRVGYHREIDAIDQKVVRLFALVSEAVAAANEALLGADTDALAMVRAGETTIDGLMVELEADIERLLLLQAPVAGELRYALTLIRIVPELERSGDLAVHIAKRAGTGLVAQLTPAARGLLERMGTVTADLWRGAADAFADRDPTAGDRLEAEDDEVDDLHTKLTTEVLSGSLTPTQAAEAVLVARFYERLADHAVHIAVRVARAVA